MNLEEFQHQVNKVSSLIGEHCHILYGLIKWLRPKVVVEVGCWHGASAMWIAQAIKENDNKGVLYCIDDFSYPTTHPQRIYSNLYCAGLESLVTMLIGKSQEVIWPNEIDFAFIDGDHAFEICQHDVDLAIEKGASCVVVHDTYSDLTVTKGPRLWLKKFRSDPKYQNWGVIEVPFGEGLAIALKNPPEKISS
jgi:predicted O-methyltransferase YrrM